MAVPKKKVSKSRRNKRRAHLAIGSINIVENKATGEPQLPHHVSVDGYYNGKKVIIDKVKEADPVEEVQKLDKPSTEQVVAVEEQEATEPKQKAKSGKEEQSKKEVKPAKKTSAKKETKEKEGKAKDEDKK